MGRLDILVKLFAKIYVNSVVRDEVLGYDSHKERGALAEFIKRAQIVESKKYLGEDSAIEVAKSKNTRVFLVDDFVAIKKAKMEGLEVYSCPFLLLLALKKKIISKQEFDGLLDTLLSFNY